MFLCPSTPAHPHTKAGTPGSRPKRAKLLPTPIPAVFACPGCSVFKIVGSVADRDPPQKSRPRSSNGTGASAFMARNPVSIWQFGACSSSNSMQEQFRTRHGMRPNQVRASPVWRTQPSKDRPGATVKTESTRALRVVSSATLRVGTRMGCRSCFRWNVHRRHARRCCIAS